MSFAVALAVLAPAQPAQAYSGFQYPCYGYGVVGYSFGQYVSGWGYHVGEDVCGGAGNPVYAAADGTVMYSAKTPDSYRWGNLIMIQSDDGFGGQLTTIYGHLSNDRRVGAGATVSKGQLIGFTGPSYTSENGNWSAHLHFGVRSGSYNAAVGTYDAGIVGYKNTTSGYYPGGQIIAERQVVYDYQVVNVIGHGNYGKNQEFYVDFQLKNTGNQTWHMNGTDAMRLGTIRPTDRGSEFSIGEIGQGWASNNRIALMSDTAPGQVGVFRAKFSDVAVPAGGPYIERFAPVIDGRGWLPDKDLAVGVVVLPPRYAAQWMGQGVYTTMSPTSTAGATSANYLAPGQRLDAKAYLKNTGDVAWTSDGPNPVRLATARPNDRGSAFATGGVDSIPNSENWPAYNRPSGIDGRLEGDGTITPTGTINPGETGVFSFAITVPNQPGQYNEYFQPMIEGLGWMPDLGMYFPLRVLPPGNHYEWVGQENPGSIQLGRTGSIAHVYVRNVGQSPWPVNGNVRLGTDRGQDRPSEFANAWPTPNRAGAVDANLTNPGDQTVYPGNVARFSVNLSSDTVRDGTYQEYFRPVVDGVGWMPEDYGIYLPVTVSSPARDYKVISQTFSADVGNLHYGQELNAKLAVRNLGTTPWDIAGASPVRLGTSRPNDRSSGFNVTTGSDPWLAVNRASNIDGKVVNLSTLETTSTTAINQSEIAYLNIPLKVPYGLNPGPYNEYFNFVQEGQTWFPDLGIYFPLVVTGN